MYKSGSYSDNKSLLNYVLQLSFNSLESKVKYKILTLIIVDMTSFFDSCFDSFFNSSSVNPSMYFFISSYERNVGSGYDFNITSRRMQ